MRSFSPAVIVILTLSLSSALLVLGAAGARKHDNEGFSDDSHFDDNNEHQQESFRHPKGHALNQHLEHQHDEIGHENHRENDNSGLLGGLTGMLTGGVGESKMAPLSPLPNLLALGGGIKESGSVLPTGPVSKAASIVAAPIKGAVAASPLKKLEEKIVEKKIEEKEEKKDAGLLQPVKSITDVAKLALNPLELVKHISTNFKLPLSGLVEKVGAGLIFGLEAFLQPLLTCVKIVEKIFKPNACSLKFICKLTHPLHAFAYQHMPKFSTHFLEQSAHIKALADGISGKDCELQYSECTLGGSGGLKLKKPFEELKELKESKIDPAKLAGARSLDKLNGPSSDGSPVAAGASGQQQEVSNSKVGQVAQKV